MTTYREFVDFAKNTVEDIREEFTKPDDDWLPTVVIDGAESVAICPLMVPKDYWPGLVVFVSKQLRARKVAMVTSAWTIELPEGETPEQFENNPDAPTVANSPDRIEVVNVTVIDSERAEGWQAKILRSKSAPPTLGDWDGSDSIMGRMVDPIQEALR